MKTLHEKMNITPDEYRDYAICRLLAGFCEFEDCNTCPIALSTSQGGVFKITKSFSKSQIKKCNSLSESRKPET